MFSKKIKISKRIDTIFADFYHQRGITYFNNLYHMGDMKLKNLKDTHSFGDNYLNYVDKYKLLKCIDSCFLDIIKFKEYHFNPYEKYIIDNNIVETDSNHHHFSFEWSKGVHLKDIHESKAAAFIVKWLLVTQPLVLLNLKDEDMDSNQGLSYATVNQVFALDVALYTLRLQPNDIEEKEYRELLYDFRFRPFHERDYFSRFELLQTKNSFKSVLGGV